MRVLVLSNFFPPRTIGGYEVACSEAVDGLRKRGHHVDVLTSSYRAGRGHPQQPDGVFRWLSVPSDFRRAAQPRLFDEGRWIDVVGLVARERSNHLSFTRILDLSRPDVIYVWNLSHASASLAYAAQQSRIPVVFFVFDRWVERADLDPGIQMWRNRHCGPRRVAWALARRLLAPRNGLAAERLVLRHCHFGSRYLADSARAAAVAQEPAKVVYWGVDPEQFRFRSRRTAGERLLYVGQVAAHKGVHTAVEALHLLRNARPAVPAMLTIVGTGVVPNYEMRVRELVRSHGLDAHVRFTGHVARELLPAIYDEHDLLLFPSTWEEPFGMTLLEAMASGLAVVGTATGGSAEILRDGDTGLVFPQENAAACAGTIARLLRDGALTERLRLNARERVVSLFALERAIDAVEAALHEATAARDVGA
jgi:glycogen(starch) synthase